MKPQDNKRKHLFSPWRMEYIASPSSRKDVFLNALESGDDRQSLILYRGKTCFVIMNLFPYNNGHLMIVPYRKVDTMVDLDGNELTEIMKVSKDSMNIINKHLKANGFNFGLNIGKCAGAGIDDHLHFHIIPRWDGDNNFMPAIGNTKVIVQGLLDTYDQLLPSFQKIS